MTLHTQNINSSTRAASGGILLRNVRQYLTLVIASFVLGATGFASAAEVKALDIKYTSYPPAPERQTVKDADKKSEGCVTCHTGTDRHTMHANPGVVLGCTDCHGGDVAVKRPKDAEYKGKDDALYSMAMNRAHISPRFPKVWNTPDSANPKGSYAKLNKESKEFVRFINPGDLRVARDACGACHLETVQQVERSLMSTSAMLWGGASYNNGILPYKRYILG